SRAISPAKKAIHRSSIHRKVKMSLPFRILPVRQGRFLFEGRIKGGQRKSLSALLSLRID
ncbi:MAG TPA: hypothetical protein DDX51_04225, partial [Clostridiales bacterium]|nr:hypothetical protein [Clostridiales bacterium]